MEENQENSALIQTMKFDNLCRICLKEKDGFDDDSMENIATIIKEFCNIEIYENVKLPRNICRTCRTETEKCYLFRLKIIQSHNILCKIVERTDFVKEETEVHENIIEEELKEYTCEVCKGSRIFKTAALLERHKRAHEHKCDECGKIFLKKNYLTKHKLIHDKSIECNECDATFSDKARLLVHVRSHTGEKPYSCSVCSRPFSTTSRLQSHMKTHTEERPYKCDVCDKTFPYNGSLVNHRRIHGERKYKCECGQLFTQKAHLTTHTMMKHTHKKPFMCSVCGETFATKAQLQSHTMQHTGEQKPKRHACETCDKAFATATELKLHRRVHTNERPFACEFCGKKFRSSSHMNTHRKIHTGERNYVCSFCGKGFRESTSLKTHLRTHTGERPYSCATCNMAFAKSGTLKTHMNVHRKEIKAEADAAPEEIQEERV